ncbi:MAG TPA: MFS transporter [Candidatus Saccharimonadales bacterium]|nr:MFS transporter [Candidatus Saccharimonadales bacterium]
MITSLVQAKRNLWKYYTATFLGGLAFFYNTIDTLYYRHFSLSFAQIGLLAALSAGVQLVLELPSGAIADVYGKKKSLIVASILLCLAVGAMTIGSSFTTFLIAFALWGASGAFRSGADSALLYDSLQHIELESKYRTYTGRTKALSLSLDILSAGLAPLLFGLNVRLPYLISFIACAALVIVSFSFYEINRNSARAQGLFVSNYKQVASASREIVSHRLLLWLVLFNTLLFTAGGIFSEIIASPFMIEVKHYTLHEFAGVLIIANIIQTGVAFFADRIARTVGVKGGFALIGLGVPVLLVLLLLSPSLVTAGLFWGMIFALWSFGEIVISNDLAHNASDAQRATVFSFSSFTTSGLTLAALPLAGLLATHTSLSTTLLTVAALFGVMSVTLLLLHGKAARPPIRD